MPTPPPIRTPTQPPPPLTPADPPPAAVPPGPGPADQAKDAARRAEAATRSFLAGQPLVAVAAGAAVGAVLGWLVKR